ncbi:type I glyceraldehyde-3-phosphate dehydrogenase [Gilvibacter sp.]|uniref:type I glyceraldehyde-3-phosphate dehydrogenase n=1 Tax=Gilvibacter sp. TaxID=2729997 RepID=UPI003B521408
MAKIKVAINGFGRIGRTFFKTVHQHDNIEVVAINDLADSKTLAHLLKYDSIHGVFQESISATPDHILVGERAIPLSNAKTPEACNWQGVDVVLEATGKFKDRNLLEGHLSAGAEKVILSVPPNEDDIPMVILGVNQQQLDADEKIISNASCTTNNAAPMVQIIDQLCGVEQAYITTVHSYTTDQSLHDQPHRDLRRARAAGLSIVPTTTGAAKALTKVFPDLADVIGGCGIRVPVPNGSMTDITFNVKREVSIEEVNAAFKKAAAGEFIGILDYTEDPIVSVDIVGNKHSCVFDSGMTSVIGRMVKIIGWYDNESGYSQRLADLIGLICKK